MGLAALACFLWWVWVLFVLLLFKLEEEQLVLAGGRTRWLAHATREVETVQEEIRRTEVLRAKEVEAVGASLGVGVFLSLGALAGAAPPP